MTDRVHEHGRVRTGRLAAVVADSAGVVRQWSDGAERLFGYTSADAVGQSIADLIIPEPLWDLHEAGLRRLARDGTSPRLGGTYTMPARDAANRYFPVDLTLFPIPVPDGTWIVGVMRPTTDDTSTSTTPTQDVVLSIFERAPEAITILDPLGRQINVNAAGAAMMGYNEGDQHAADGHAFIHPDDRDRTARHMADVVAGTIAPSTPCRYRVLAGDGRWVWLETLMADLIDVPGINAYAAFSRDVTQDEARRTELEAARRSAEEAGARLHRLASERLTFAASISHELLTPLTSISSAVESLLSDDSAVTEDRSDYLRLIGRNTGRLTRLVEDLLVFSRLEAGTLTLSTEPVDVLQVLRDAVDTVRSAADRRSITFDLTDDQGPLVLGDEDRMRQLVENLIDNAVKYADASTKVTVRASCDGHAWSVVVENRGPQIEADDADRIFEPFFRSPIAGQAAPGTGLGLPLARGIAELHGGTLTYDATYTGGARFVLMIPRG